MLPIRISPSSGALFDVEVPYYNWYYPVVRSREIRLDPLPEWGGRFEDAKSVYVHFPFCTSLCSYCPYIRTTRHDEGVRDRYIDRLVAEIRSFRAASSPAVSSVFFGGGTPSLMTPRQFGRVMEALHAAFRLDAGCEITVECAAKSLTDELSAEFHRAGVSTTRIGVQSFDPAARGLFALAATVADVARAVDTARRAGLGVSVDLLFGFHGQSPAAVLADVEAAHALAPDTIETYAINLLSVPERYWTGVDRLGLLPMTARVRVEAFRLAREALLEAGYHQWSGHGFARSPEFDLLYHRSVYGSGGGYVGFGPGAASVGADCLKINHQDIDRYLDDGHPGPRYCHLPISEEQRRAKPFVSELPYFGRCRPAFPPGGEVADRLGRLADAGAVRREGEGWVLTEAGRTQYASMMYFLLPTADRDILGQEMFDKIAALGGRFRRDMLWIR